MLDIGEPAASAVVALLAARSLGAGFADRFQGDARGLVGFGKVGFGGRERVGRGAAFAGCGFDLADQRLALRFEFLRRVDQFGTFVGRLISALGERGDLSGRIVIAVVPFLALGGDGAQPVMSKLGFARNRLGLAALLGASGALARDCRVDIGKLAFDLAGVRQGGECVLRFGAGELGLIACRADALAGFLERRKARRVAADLALGGGRVARARHRCGAGPRASGRALRFPQPSPR